MKFCGQLRGTLANPPNHDSGRPNPTRSSIFLKALTSKRVLEGERKEAPDDIRSSHSSLRRRCPHRAGSPEAEAGCHDSEELHGNTADLTT
jgi:hypothetical protein